MTYTHQYFGSGYTLVSRNPVTNWCELRKDAPDGSYSLVADYFKNLKEDRNT